MSTRCVHIGFFWAALICLIFANGASAQQPAGAFPYDSTAKVPGNKFFKNALENQELPTGAELTAMQNYIVRYSLPQLTLPGNITTLPEKRDQIKRDLQRATNGTGPAVDLFNELALKTLTAMLDTRYDLKPVVRYNAVILIGELDETVGKEARAAPRKAVPYLRALGVLINKVGKASEPDYLRAAALRGIVRHAQVGISARAAPVVQTAMLARLNEKALPAGRTVKVHTWMRRRAADALGAMKSNGQNDAVFNALEAVLKGANEPLLLRGTVAASLSQLPLDRVSGMTAARLAALRKLMQETRDEANRAGAIAPVPKTPAASKTPVGFPAP